MWCLERFPVGILDALALSKAALLFNIISGWLFNKLLRKTWPGVFFRKASRCFSEKGSLEQINLMSSRSASFEKGLPLRANSKHVLTMKVSDASVRTKRRLVWLFLCHSLAINPSNGAVALLSIHHAHLQPCKCSNCSIWLLSGHSQGECSSLLMSTGWDYPFRLLSLIISSFGLWEGPWLSRWYRLL